MVRRKKNLDKRIYTKEMMLSEKELRQFNQAKLGSGLNTGDFMRQRCLHIIKRKQVPLSQIQIYQKLGELQQGCQQMLVQIQKLLPTGGCVGCAAVEEERGQSRELGDGEGQGTESSGSRAAGDIVMALEQHLSNLKALRQQVAKLTETAGNSSVTGETEGIEADVASPEPTLAH